jgi:hypothetical protein
MNINKLIIIQTDVAKKLRRAESKPVEEAVDGST